jgi:hypothetical protein
MPAKLSFNTQIKTDLWALGKLKENTEKIIFFEFLKSMKKGVGSGV